LFKAYPKFSASLKKVFSDGDILEKGASEEEIKIVESNIGIKLPEDITEFF
jgi:cell wall assembly regulator SMI1